MAPRAGARSSANASGSTSAPPKGKAKRRSPAKRKQDSSSGDETEVTDEWEQDRDKGGEESEDEGFINVGDVSAAVIQGMNGRWGAVRGRARGRGRVLGRAPGSGKATVRIPPPVAGASTSAPTSATGPVVTFTVKKGARKPAKRPKLPVNEVERHETASLVSTYLAGEGESALCTRPDPQATRRIRSLSELALQRGALTLYGVMVQPSGMNMSEPSDYELSRWREFIERLPPKLSNSLLSGVLTTYSDRNERGKKDNDRLWEKCLSRLFFHATLSTFTLPAVLSTAKLLSPLSACINLVALDLSDHTELEDGPLGRLLSHLKALEVLVLRGCTRAGDLAMQDVSLASGRRLRVANLTLTAVTTEGLKSLLSRCLNLEVLKVAHVKLTDLGVADMMDKATEYANRQFKMLPLGKLKTLKLRKTDLSEAAVNRILSFCAPTLERLDLSYCSRIKSLDLVTQVLRTLSDWRLEKLVVSGLPLSVASLQSFIEAVASRPEEQRLRFKIFKLAGNPRSAGPGLMSIHQGLSDSGLATLMPRFALLRGLEKVSLSSNINLGVSARGLTRFVETIGRHCITLELNDLPYLSAKHLEALRPLPLEELDDDALQFDLGVPSRLQHLYADDTHLTDAAVGAISSCADLRTLRIKGTAITGAGVKTILDHCPRLTALSLLSCRGIPRSHRRTPFEAYAAGTLGVEED